MGLEIKIECTNCRAHYIADEHEVASLKCLKCGNNKFVRLEQKNQPPSGGGIRSLLGAAGINVPAAPAFGMGQTQPLVQAPLSAPKSAPHAPPTTQNKTQSVSPAHVTSTMSPPPSTSTIPPAPQRQVPKSDAEAIARIKQVHDDVTRELAKVVTGNKQLLDEFLVAILCGGHCLIEGPEGTARSLVLSSMAKVMSLTFKRVQCTPDLGVLDLTGSDIMQEDPATKQRKAKFAPGPLFANVIFFDEIERANPKAQGLVIEALQEKHVTVDGNVHKLEKAFFVVASFAAHIREDSHPLTETMQDHFIFKLKVGYPGKDEEADIIRNVSEAKPANMTAVCNIAELLRMQESAKAIPIADQVLDYANRLARATRPHQEDSAEAANKYLELGAGPRASIALVAAAKCFSALDGRLTATFDDVVKAAKPVLRHRLVLNQAARSEGLTPDTIIDRLLSTIGK